LLETIRQYAAVRLADSGTAEDVRARHADYYRTLAAALAPELTGPSDVAATERLSADIENLRLMLDWYHDRGQADIVADVIMELGLFWFGRGNELESIARLEGTIDALDDDHLLRSRVHAHLAWMKSVVGFAGVPEHAEQSAEHAALAGIPTPVPSFNGLGVYYMAFVGDTLRAIEQTQLAVAAAQAEGDLYWAAWSKRDCLFYTALLAPGTDDTLRLADEVRRDIERTGSVVLRQQWLTATAVALRTVDLDRALALLDESVELATRENLREAGTIEFFRGLMLFARHRYADAATALRRALVGDHDTGNRLGMLNVLSAVTGVAERTGRPETAAALLAGLRAARDEYQLPGSANERHAEARIEEHLQRRPGHQDAAHQIRRLDIEATIDLALDTLDVIAADAPA
jgi:tetratricopeptide (TPR) repeat protein